MACTISGTLIGSSASAQWSNVGVSDIANANSGNVGINTSTPAERLTILDGNISMPATNDKAIRVIT